MGTVPVWIPIPKRITNGNLDKDSTMGVEYTSNDSPGDSLTRGIC